MKLQEKEKKINEITEEEKHKDVQYIIKKEPKMKVQDIEDVTDLKKSKEEYSIIIYKNQQKFEIYIEKFGKLPPEKRKSILNRSENYKNQSTDI